MVFRVEISTDMYGWARERSGRDPQYLTNKFRKLPEWESGVSMPTFAQLQSYAKSTYTPFGYFFLPEPPPAEKLPIPDFRAGIDISRPSVNLLDTIYTCQQRQDWYREHAVANGFNKVNLAGSDAVNSPPRDAAARLHAKLGRVADQPASSWSEKLRQVADIAEQAGVLVMINSVVGNNNYRKLDIEEFSGFALFDDFAPVVFVNSAESKRAQIFTLAHEIAHIAAKRTGLDRSDLGEQVNEQTERWCNETAAEFLVPMSVLQAAYDLQANITDELRRLARKFRVSNILILRRLYDAGLLDWDKFLTEYQLEQSREHRRDDKDSKQDGNSFYDIVTARAGGKAFIHAIISSAKVGETPYRDVFHMLQIRKHSTFRKLSCHIGVP